MLLSSSNRFCYLLSIYFVCVFRKSPRHVTEFTSVAKNHGHPAVTGETCNVTKDQTRLTIVT